MINMNPKFVAEYLKTIMDERAIDAYERELSINIEDIDDLHDWTIESEEICQIDAVYHALCAILPLVLDEVVDYVDEINDSYDDGVWGTYAMRESIGFCDF